MDVPVVPYMRKDYIMKLSLPDLIELFKTTYKGTIASFAENHALNKGNFSRFLCGHRGCHGGMIAIMNYLIETLTVSITGIIIKEAVGVVDALVLITRRLSEFNVKWLLFIDGNSNLECLREARNLIDTHEDSIILIYCHARGVSSSHKYTVGWENKDFFILMQSETDIRNAADIALTILFAQLSVMTIPTLNFAVVSTSHVFVECISQISKTARVCIRLNNETLDSFHFD